MCNTVRDETGIGLCRAAGAREDGPRSLERRGSVLGTGRSGPSREWPPPVAPSVLNSSSPPQYAGRLSAMRRFQYDTSTDRPSAAPN